MTKRERVKEIIARATKAVEELEHKRAEGTATLADDLETLFAVVDASREADAVISHVEHPGPVMELAPNDGTGTRLWIAGNRKEPTT